MLDIQALVGAAGSATVVGALSGFAARKLIRIIAALLGIQFAFLAYLEHYGLITVNWDGIGTATNEFFQAITSMTVPQGATAQSISGTGGAIGGFSLGFLLGFFKG